MRALAKRPLRKGELLDSTSGRPYVPDRLDIRYGVPPEKWGRKKSGKLRSFQAGEYGRLDVPKEHTRTALTAKETIAALEKLKDVPFVLTCSFGPPHPPMVLPKPYYGMYPAKSIKPPASIGDPMKNSPYRAKAVSPKNARYKDKDNVRQMASNYYGLVKEVDDWVGKILGKLKDLGLEKKTLVIFTSDHGEMLGSHGMHSKTLFYEESAHIPLIMRLPGVIAPKAVVSGPVSQINMFATILDYCGAAGGKSHGRSLRALIAGKAKDWPDYCCSEWEGTNVPNLMVRTDGWKLMFGRRDKRAVRPRQGPARDEQPAGREPRPEAVRQAGRGDEGAPRGVADGHQVAPSERREEAPRDRIAASCGFRADGPEFVASLARPHG